MTDQTPDRDDAVLRRDLDTWFQGEVRQAAADLRRAPLRPARARLVPARGVAGPAFAAALVVILVVAGVSRLPNVSSPLAEPTSSALRTAPVDPAPSRTPSPSATAATGDYPFRYLDGIPAEINGEPVHRPRAMDSLLPEGESFLIGGWLSHVEAVRLCLVSDSPLEPCANPILALTPGSGEGRSVLLEAGPVDEGPVVFRAHINDQRATGCVPTRVPACRSTLVAEAIVWVDDEVTRTAPITTVEAVNRLAPLLPGGVLLLTSRAWDPRIISIAEGCDPGFPVQQWSTQGLAIAMVLVFSSVAAREAVDDNFNASGWRGTRRMDGLSCTVMTDSFYNHEWIAVDNVMVAIQVNASGATPEQAQLVYQVPAALQGAPRWTCQDGISCPIVPGRLPSPSPG